jgi:hypothetical protein
MEANVDLMHGGQGVGPVANAIAMNGQLNLGAMRPFIGSDGRAYITTYKGTGDPKLEVNWDTRAINNNALLRRDEWKQLDDVLVEVGRQRLGGVQDLIDKGLVLNLGNAMGTTVLEWHDVSDGMEAVVSMDGVTRGKNDKVTFQHNYLPIPIIHSDYEINARTLAASRSLGNPLDTISVERATRSVLQKLENMLFTNTTYAFGEKDARSRNSIYSYINFPDRNQVTLSTAWTDAGKTAAQILADVVAMKDAAIADLHFGPYQLYIPTLYDTVLDEDYSTAGSSMMTIRERIMKIAGITGIKVVDTLPANNVVLVQMTSDVVRLVRGMGLQNVEWEVEGKMITKYKVMTIQVPQLRSDANGKSGIVHLA